PLPKLPTATSATPAMAPRSSVIDGPLHASRPRGYGMTHAVRSRSVSHRSTSPVRSLRAWAKERTSPRIPGLQRLRPALARADPDHRVHRNGPHLAVTDLAGLRGLDDDVDHVLGVVLLGEDLQAHLRHQVDLVLRAAVDLGVAALAAVAAGLADRHALDAELLQGRFDVIELERLDDRGDESHASTFLAFSATAAETAGPLGEDTPDACTDPRSYPVSAWVVMSTPVTSASWETRKPMVLSITLAMIQA